MVARAAALTFVVLLASSPASAAFDRLPVPGGANALRRVTEMPSSVTDDMLLVEVARAWYGTHEPVASPTPALQRLLTHVQSSSEALAGGPALPLTPAIWEWLLECGRPCNLAAALVANREAMLLYHGLVAVDDETLRWMAAHPDVLRELLRGGAAAFAFAGPFIHVRGGAVVVPGGTAMNAAWEAAVGAPVSAPDAFVPELMRRSGGRIAWLFSVLAQLDAPRLRFALRDANGESSLSGLLRYATSSSPEWNVSERPFWRTPFDFTLVLALADFGPGGVPRGSPSFWRLVFRSDDLGGWRETLRQPLTADALLAVLFEDPYAARERWEVFSLGQRLPGVEDDSPDVGLMLRGARRHPALAQMLDRIGVTSPSIVLPLHRGAARVFDRDQTGSRGELGAWQGALSVVERAALSGGLDKAGAEALLGKLAALPLEQPRAELSAWFLDAMVGAFAARPGAATDAERLVLQVIAGLLTPSGPRREPEFPWEDLSYSYGGPASLVTRMEQVRVAQGTASIEDARTAWRIAAGEHEESAQSIAARLQDCAVPAEAPEIGRRLERARERRDSSGLRREARHAAEAIVMAVLPILAYVPHLAVTEVPSLGADVAFRHEFVSADDGPPARRRRPWQLARGQAGGGPGWRLQGSLLQLDLAVPEWYLRRNGEPATAQPMFDEGDMTALAQVAALARSARAAPPGLLEAVAAVPKGRQAASAFPSLSALDSRLAEVGVDPWRRRSVIAAAPDAAAAAARLSYGEAWRLGGAPGLLSPHPAIDGGAHFGAVPHLPLLMQGRRSAGVIGASAIDAQLRVAIFLESRRLPLQLFGDVVAGTLADLIEGTYAARPDDFAAFAAAVMRLDDTRMEEHLLALVADGTLARPVTQAR